jgi:hypothetical protein
MDLRTEETQSSSIGVQKKQTPEQPNLWKRLSAAIFANWRLKGALILMLLIAGMYGWKNMAVRRVERETKKQAVQLSEATDEIVKEKDRALLRLTAIPLSWVVRTEIPKGNYDNIDQYFKQIIKEDRFKVILFAGSDGKIFVSTDKRMEGEDLSQYYPASLLEQYEVSVSQLNSNELIAAAPVIGLTAKLGVLIMVYPVSSPGENKAKP